MDINSKTQKKVMEASYLTADNAHRYRVILRIAYSQYEKMKLWLYKEDIYTHIKGIQGFDDYSLDNLKQDLDSLELWRNFLTIQDTGRAKNLEEFKNRKFKYQISPYTIELERTLIKLEGANEISRGSLEISLIERFKDTLKQINNLALVEEQEIFSWWNTLNSDFKTLNENYQDYISIFYSPKTEQMLKTTEFLLFKENFIRYIRNFIKGIQMHIPEIMLIFQNINDDLVKQLIKKLIEYEKNNISLDKNYNIEEKFDLNYERYINIKQWFIGDGKNISMIDSLLNNTNEIVRKITRYALQIIDMKTSGGSRKEEYKTLVNIFNNCVDIEEAHKLSSVVFGVISSRHIVCESDRETESINSSIFEEKSTIVTVKPSNRYREKTASRVYVKDKSREKKEKAIEVLRQREKERYILESRIKDNKLSFKDLDGITRDERTVFLRWLSLGLNRKNNEWVKNEFGKFYKVANLGKNETILIKCKDGDLTMPAYELIFKEE